MTDWFVRPADLREIGPVANWMAQLTPWRELDYSSDRLRRIMEAELGNTFVAVAPGESSPVGLLVARPQGAFGQPYLVLLAVRGDYHRLGVGASLLKWWERRECAAGARNLFLCVSRFNTTAQSFYRKHGWIEVGVLSDYLRGGMDEVVLRKTFGPLL